MTGKVGGYESLLLLSYTIKELETNPLCTPNEGW